MTRTLPLILAGVSLIAGERKPLPGQAGNDDIELVASVLLGKEEIHDALGADLGDGYIVFRVKATPKTDHPIRVGPDDFTAISRKDGQRSQALAPSQIAGGGGALVVKPGNATRQGGGISIGGFGGGIGSSGPVDKGVDAKIEAGDSKAKENPLLAVLKGKALPDKETSTAVEGLLYFPIEGKLKPKDLGLVYKGPAGKLVIEFAK